MKPNRKSKHAVQWFREYLAEHPGATVDELARAATDEGVAVSKGLVARLRREVRLPVSFVGVLPPQEQESAIIPSLVKQCARCGGDHWASQCAVPVQVRVPWVPVTEEALDALEGIDHEEEEPVNAPKIVPPPPAEESPPIAKAKDRMLRRQALNEMLDKDPGADPLKLVVQLRERFGKGLDWRYVYETCRVARELHHLPQLGRRVDVDGRQYHGRDALPTFAPDAPPPEVIEEEDGTIEEDLAWLAKQAGDIMRAHSVTEITLKVVGGKARWGFQVSRTGEGEIDL